MNYSSENDPTNQNLIDCVVRYLIRQKITISVMESCTGGLFASCLTDTEGASGIFPGSFVTYSNTAKERCGVPAGILERFGVYSPETAEAMAEACRSFYRTEIGVGITGSTGNADPNNPDSVPGEVFYAILFGEKRCVRKRTIATGDLSRSGIKERIVADVTQTLAELLGIAEKKPE